MMFVTCKKCESLETCCVCEESYCARCEIECSEHQKTVLKLLREDDCHPLCPSCLDKVSHRLSLPLGSECVIVVRVVDGEVGGISRTTEHTSIDSVRCIVLDDYYLHSDDALDRVRYLKSLAIVRSLSKEDVPDWRMEEML